MADRTRLVDRLRYERDARIDHALFYWTQVFMAYNSNHMEGSTLTPEQTRQIYDTGRLLADADEQIRLDDAIETVQTGRCFSTAASVVLGMISLIFSPQQTTGTPASFTLAMILPQCLQI